MGAEEKVKDYTYYLDEAKKVHEKEGDLEKRVESIIGLAREYYDSSVVQSSLMKEFHTDLNFEKLGKIQTKIFKEHEKRKGSLSDTQAYDLMKEALTEILPSIRYGWDKEQDRNLDAFRAYCSSLGEEGQKQFGLIREYIRRGNGVKAINLIIDVMMSFKMGNANRRFMEYLLPQDNLKLREQTAGYLTKNANKALGAKMNEGLLQKDIDTAFQHYVHGQYDEMKNKYDIKDQTPKEEKK